MASKRFLSIAPVCVACTCPFFVRGIWESGVRVYSLSSRFPVLSPCRTSTIRLGSLRVALPYVYPSPSTLVSLSRSCSGMQTASSMLASFVSIADLTRRADREVDLSCVRFIHADVCVTVGDLAFEASRTRRAGIAVAPRTSVNISSYVKEKTT